jgi:hypothetical protein
VGSGPYQTTGPDREHILRMETKDDLGLKLRVWGITGLENSRSISINCSARK